MMRQRNQKKSTRAAELEYAKWQTSMANFKEGTPPYEVAKKKMETAKAIIDNAKKES